MPDFKKVTSFRGEDLFINVELVQVVGPGKEDGKTLIHFGDNHAFLVMGEPVDVMEVLWPAKSMRLRSPA